MLVSNVGMHACMLLCCTWHSGHFESTNLTLLAAGTQDACAKQLKVSGNVKVKLDI